MNNTMAKILARLSTGKFTQKQIADNIGVSQGYVSQVNQILSQLSRKPVVKEGKLVCTICGNDTDLRIVKDNMGIPIAITCSECDAVRNYINDNIIITINHKKAEEFRESWKSEFGAVPSIEYMVQQLIHEFILKIKNKKEE